MYRFLKRLWSTKGTLWVGGIFFTSLFVIFLTSRLSEIYGEWLMFVGASFSIVTVITGIFLAIYIYFLPSTIAKDGAHRNFKSLFIVNIFFGWTLIGWVGCLAWAFLSQETLSD